MSAAGLPPETFVAYVALHYPIVAKSSPHLHRWRRSSCPQPWLWTGWDWHSAAVVKLVTDGELNGSVLRGNVLLRGYGDSDHAEALRRMLQSFEIVVFVRSLATLFWSATGFAGPHRSQCCAFR